MRQQRKEDLLYRFPPVPENVQRQMEGRSAANFCVFLTRGAELFVRCYHRYYGGELVECNRYVFAKDGYVRYIYYGESGCGNRWRIASHFREPFFFAPGWYSYCHDNSYCVLNADAYKDSDMRYCEIETNNTVCPIEYLRLYIRHPNIEYLQKAGYGHLLETVYNGWYVQIPTIRVNSYVNLRSNNLLKMLYLNRDEFKALKGNERCYLNFCAYRMLYPKCKPHELVHIAKAYEHNSDTLQNHCDQTGLSPARLARYIAENSIRITDYSDYLEQCVRLNYNLHDTAINMPHDFYTIHERVSALIEIEETEEMNKALQDRYQERCRLEYKIGDLFIRQPKSIKEIADEGADLGHCVGGYAERHAKGQTTILFLRKADEPDKPYYTMEINDKGKIIQCYGYKNNRAGNPKPPEIKAFEQQYERYLQEVIHGKRNKRTVRQSA